MAIDELTYPLPVANRVVASAGAAPAAVLAASGTPPRTRILAFNVSSNANLRSTGSSRLIKGPALILDLHVVSSQAQVNTLALELGIALAPVTEQDVALTTAKGWTPVTERVSQNAAAENANRVGFNAVSHLANVVRHFGPLNIPVLLDEFYITFTSQSLTAVLGTALTGHLVVLEGVSREALATFL